MSVKLNPEIELAQFVSEFYDRPYEFVLAAFDWGNGPLHGQKGPDAWQREFLETLGAEVRKRGFDGVHAVPPIRMAVSSGHGVGKSTLSAWLATWILCTRPFSIGSVTANTGQQLHSKTFAAIRTWMGRSFCAHWFEIGTERIRHKEHPTAWFCTAQTSSDDRAEAFAGQHAANSTSWYLFDEASAIPDRIWEVAEGGTSDGESHFYCFGNPTRNSGAFHRACFGSEKHRWITRCVDSRASALTNKNLIKEWAESFGEDSDFFRVRVLGKPPRAADTQFIAQDLVSDAMRRQVEVLPDTPLVAGADLSRGGSDPTVIRFRRGLDCVNVPKPIVISGQDSRDSMRTVAILADVLSKDYNGVKVSMLFLDSTGLGGPIYDRMIQLGHKNVIGVSFGSSSPVQHCANMRAYIWFMMREWLKTGAIGKDQDLESELTGPGFKYDAQSAYVLESKESMKKRGVSSPNHADALACTFAAPVGPARKSGGSTNARDRKIRSLRRTCTDSWLT